MDAKSFNPLPVPYLDHPSKVIPIDIGRQLFVDDFLVESSMLKRTFHRARKFEGNPVLKPETPVELGRNGHAPMAAPFSGGVWYDPADRLFKMWYQAGWFDGMAYATSRDGIRWERPALDIVSKTNLVLPDRAGVMRDSAAVILDRWTDDADRRFKLFIYSRPVLGEFYTSPDGIHWGLVAKTSKLGDRSTIFYNPFRKKWVYSIRSGRHGRSRDYREHDDFVAGAKWSDKDVVFWTRADRLDPPDPKIRQPAQLYNLDAVAYESLMLGAFTIHLGPPNRVGQRQGVPKMTEIMLAFSRDGFHWHRPDRRPFIAATRKAGDWDRAYLHSNAALCLVMGDELWFYYTGFAGDPARKNLPSHQNGMYANAATGIAKIRRDGFASMDAGKKGGVLTTRPVTFKGSRLFVNVDNPEGELRVEALNADGGVVAGLGRDDCDPVAADGTCVPVRWKAGGDLAALRGTPVRFRFHLRGGRLYAFWVADKSGASNGYLAGGGPGFTGPTDTVGKASLEADPRRKGTVQPNRRSL